MRARLDVAPAALRLAGTRKLARTWAGLTAVLWSSWPSIVLALPQDTVDLEPDDEFGCSVSSGRDLDGDGIPDIAMLDASYGTEGQRGGDRDVWIVSGKSGRVLQHASTPIFPRALFVRIEIVPDIDGDQRADILCGTGWWNRSSCTFGMLSGRTMTARRLCADTADDLRWWSFARLCAADLTAPSEIVVAGSTGLDVFELPSGARSRRFELPEHDPKQGLRVAALGDVDGDGFEDVGAVASKDEHASVIVFSRRTGQRLFEIKAPRGESRFGRALAGGDDIDGDGRADFAASSGEAVGYFEGRPATVRLYSGRSGDILWTAPDPSAAIGAFGRLDGGREDFGAQMCFVGDTDGDGRGDVLVGAPEARTFFGAFWLLSGRNGSTLLHGTVEPGEPGDCHMGGSLTPAGDIDQDSCSDFVVGTVSHDSTQRGAVRVFSGRTGRLIWLFTRASVFAGGALKIPHVIEPK